MTTRPHVQPGPARVRTRVGEHERARARGRRGERARPRPAQPPPSRPAAPSPPTGGSFSHEPDASSRDGSTRSRSPSAAPVLAASKLKARRRSGAPWPALISDCCSRRWRHYDVNGGLKPARTNDVDIIPPPRDSLRRAGTRARPRASPAGPRQRRDRRFGLRPLPRRRAGESPRQRQGARPRRQPATPARCARALRRIASRNKAGEAAAPATEPAVPARSSRQIRRARPSPIE